MSWLFYILCFSDWKKTNEKKMAEPMDIKENHEPMNMAEPMDIQENHEPMNIDQINSILSSEENIPTDLVGDYSVDFISCLENNWSNVKTSITLGANLYASQFSYRLASLRPLSHEHSLNYWPSVLGDHENMIRFVKGILLNFFARRRTPIYVNWSPCCVCLDDVGETHFLYSSRSNFGALNVAYLIHSDATLNEFCNVILSSYSLEKYMLEAVENLEQNYEGYVFPTTIVWHITNCTTKVYGALNTKRIYGAKVSDRGLSSHGCCTKSTDHNSDCIWLALSSMVVNGRLITQRAEKSRCKPNKRIARKLKAEFLRWYGKKKVKDGLFGHAINEKGFDERFFPLLEDFLQRNIVIFSNKVVKGKRICNGGLKEDKSHIRILNLEYCGGNKHTLTLNLLSDGKNHIRAITDPNKFSSKFLCKACNMGYFELKRLEKHDCSKKPKYRLSSLYVWRKSCDKLLNYVDMESQFTWDQKYAHLLVNKELDAISMRLHMKLEGKEPVIITENFDCESQLAEYLILFLPKTISGVLVQRFQQNLQFMNELEAKLNYMQERTKDLHFSQDGPKLHYDMLLEIKRQVIDYLSTYKLVIQCGTKCDYHLTDRILFQVLKVLSSSSDRSHKFHTKFTKGKLSYVGRSAYPIRFSSLNLFGPTFALEKVSDEQVKNFEEVIKIFKMDFNVNLLTLDSPGGIGHQILADILSPRNAVSFYSPSQEIYEHLQSVVRYGLLNSREGLIIHDEAPLKSGVCVDFSKFYARLLLSDSISDIWHLGRPLKYERKNGEDIYSCVSNRQRKTFATLVILLIEHCLTEGQIMSSLYGKEQRWSLPIDGVLMQTSGHDGKRMKQTLISIDGCLIHSDLDEICHKPNQVIDNIDPNHRKNCLICLNERRNEAKSDSRLKPRLFKFDLHETKNSPHKLRKNLTYEEVYQDTLKKRGQIAKSCSFDHIVIKECKILKFYFSPLVEFFNDIGLKIKPELEKIPFYKIFCDVAYKNFPLLKYGRKLNQQTLLQAIKNGDLTGYAVITASCGTESQKQLGIARPFFYKHEESGMPVNSFSINQKIVPTVLLKELLCSPTLTDFRVTEVIAIYEYKKHEGKNPFSDFKSKFLDSLTKNSDKKLFTQLLKSSINNCLGLFGYNCQNYNLSYLCENSNIDSIFQMTNFSHGTMISDTHSMLHFRNRRAIHNIGHIHYAIISAGKAVMIRFILQLQYFLGENILQARLNTDGISFGSKISQTEENLNTTSPNSCIFDIYLSTPISHEKASKYLAFKMKYFESIGVCPNHKAAYVKKLVENKKFKANDCCLNYKNVETDLPLNIELVFDKGLIISTNKLSFVNTATQVSEIKCGGIADSRLTSSIEHLSFNEMKKLLN